LQRRKSLKNIHLTNLISLYGPIRYPKTLKKVSRHALFTNKKQDKLKMIELIDLLSHNNRSSPLGNYYKKIVLELMDKKGESKISFSNRKFLPQYTGGELRLSQLKKLRED
jgi:hypothetical protein